MSLAVVHRAELGWCSTRWPSSGAGVWLGQQGGRLENPGGLEIGLDVGGFVPLRLLTHGSVLLFGWSFCCCSGVVFGPGLRPQLRQDIVTLALPWSSPFPRAVSKRVLEQSGVVGRTRHGMQ